MHEKRSKIDFFANFRKLQKKLLICKKRYAEILHNGGAVVINVEKRVKSIFRIFFTSAKVAPGCMHICYKIYNLESWYRYHYTWANILPNIHRKCVFFTKNFKKSVGRNFCALIYDSTGGPRTFPFFVEYTTLVSSKIRGYLNRIHFICEFLFHFHPANFAFFFL